MSTTTDTTTPGSRDPYIRGTDETVLLDLRELRAQEAADKAARDAAARSGSGAGAGAGAPGIPGAELERYHGSHRREAVLYADGGTAIPLDRVREVCHDLRQPVAAILMLASAAEMRPDVPERVRDVLQEIMSQTEEISATVRQFLDDAKQGVDGLGEPVPCNVAGLAAESVERWRATFDGDLALAAAEDPLHVTVDPVLFKRALGNVLSNGTRAAGDSGRVQVTVRRFETAQGERAVIEVDDSGPGFGNIPAGHGLGLAVVRRTIEAAGGSVEFAEGPLGGALVRLVLPVTPIRPLSADDELTKTFHGEISLSQLAAELAAGRDRERQGVPPALAEFEDDDFDGFDELDDLDDLDGARDLADLADSRDFGGTPDARAAGGHSLTGGHAFTTTRISAWPEPMAISGTPEQLAIGGAAGPGNLFGARPAEQGAGAPVVPPPTAIGGAADNRSYFGLPAREPAAQESAQAAVADRGFFGAPEHKSAPADRGYFGLPLKTDSTASQAPATPTTAEPVPAPTAEPRAPHSRLYGAPAEIAAAAPQRSDIAAHPVPASLLSTRRAPAPHAAHEIAAAAPGAFAAAAQPSVPQSPVAVRKPLAPAPATLHAAGSNAAATPQPQHAAASGAAVAHQAASAAPTAAASAAGPATPRPSAPSPADSAAPAAFGAPIASAAPAASAAAPTAPTAQPAATPNAAAPAPSPTFDPSDTQPLHIIPTGQDDTALASIQLPSQANLTHPPRIPASALQPVASVQLSLLPGGAF